MRTPQTKITREKERETGFVILLGLLLWYFHSGDILFIKVSVICVLVSLVVPAVLKPVAYAWYGLSEAMGAGISRILLTAIFFLIITPMGAVRRVISKERLMTEQWKKSRGSVFKDRSVCFTKSDLKNPF